MADQDSWMIPRSDSGRRMNRTRGTATIGLAIVAIGRLSETLYLERGSRQIEPVVTVQGILQSGEFLGRPGYGEDPQQDARESSYYLQLPAPIPEQNPNVRLGSEFDRRGELFAQLVP